MRTYLSLAAAGCLVMGLSTILAAAEGDPGWYSKRPTPRETYVTSSTATDRQDETYGPWHVMGPFDNTNGAGFATAYPPERQVDLKAEYVGADGKKVRWQRMDKFKDGRVNSLLIFDRNEYVCAYLYREIDSPTAKERPVELGSDDTLTVWLNGRQLMAKNVARACMLGDDRLTLPLKKGINKLLIKICQGNQGFGFAFAARQQVGPDNSRLAVLLRRDFPGQDAEIDRLIEIGMQFDRLEAHRSGRMPVSKFAKPEHVHRSESLLAAQDRDPADIVLRRTEALLADLSKAAGVRDLAPERLALADLRRASEKITVADAAGRRELHLKLCELRRRIALANPLLDFDKIVFITHKRNRRSELLGDHMAGQYYGIHATPGEGLFVLDGAFGDKPTARNLLADSVCVSGRLAGGKLPDGAYLSPDLSFDGRRIVFAYTEAAGYRPAQLAPEDQAGMYNYSGLKCSFTEQNCWHLFSVNVDGTDLRRITDGRFNDFDPCWLPSGKIAFISDRRGGFGRCHMTANGGAPWFTYTLHRVDANGAGMARLSSHETCEWQPSVAHDGSILYTRWDYVDRGFFQAHHPWKTLPDGRAAMSLHGNYPRDWKDRPCMEMDIRAIPGSRKLVAVAAAHHGQTYGSLVMIDPEVEDDDAMAPVKLITPDERLPESEYGYFCREAAYATPWPLSEDYYLCVFGYPEPGQPDTVENYGLYLLDAFGNTELLYRNPAIACMSPIPLKPRPRPPVITDEVQPLAVDPNQPRLNLDRPGNAAANPVPTDKAAAPAALPDATVMITNVYRSRHAWPEGTKIKSLRIVQVLPKSTPGRNNPAIGYGTEKNARAVLGTVPVEADGSVNFRLKPGVPVYFQALDEKGRAVQSMRTDVYAAPGERVSCEGCHEKRTTSPTPEIARPLAMMREPSTIAPEPDGSNPFNYIRLVQPVLDRNCVPCHTKKEKVPSLSGVKDNKQWVPSYRSLKPYAFYYDGGGSFTESKTYPGKFGALASGLHRMLIKGHHDVKLSSEDMRRITLWLDCNSDFYGTYENLPAQDRGEIVRPVLE